MRRSPDILTAREAAAFLGVKCDTLYLALKAGKVPGRKIGGQWRLSKQRLLEYIRAEDSPSPTANTVPATLQEPIPDRRA